MATRLHTIAAADAGQTLLAWLCKRLGLSREDAERYLTSRKVRVNGTPCPHADWRLRAGQRVEVPTPAKAQVDTTPAVTVRHVDDALVVVEKPAGLTTMRHAEEAAEFGKRGQRYLPTTLADLLPGLLAARNRGKPVPVRAVHRLDRDTTGLVVFARTVEAERHLGQQFRDHTVERLYRAIVRGEAASATIETSLVRDRGDGRRGSGADGQRAVTRVRLIEALGDFSLVECRLETGRTHQVRIHLGEAGTPLCGERVYDRPVNGRPVADASGMRRTALHAATLALDHPTTGKRLHWSSPLPDDMADLLQRLRTS